MHKEANLHQLEIVASSGWGQLVGRMDLEKFHSWTLKHSKSHHKNIWNNDILKSVCVVFLFFVLFFCRWVREFLNDENKGLDVLVDYLSFAQCAVM